MFFPRIKSLFEKSLLVLRVCTCFPENDLCGLFCDFPGESNTLRNVFWGFQYHAVGKSTTAETAVLAGEECVQFPGKGKAPVYAGVTRYFTPENHPKRHNSPCNGTACTTCTTDTYGKS